MSNRTAYPATEADGNVLHASDIDKLPGGWIGYVEITSNLGTFTSGSQDLSGLSVTVTVNSSRRVRIEGRCRWSSDVAADDAQLQVNESSTVLQKTVGTMPRTTVSYGAFVSVVLTPSSGSHTYKLTGGREAGTGNVSLAAGATSPAFLLVEDIGPA